MADDPMQGQSINAYFDTRRRITAIEKKALQKTGKEPAPLLEKCSFCARPENEVVLLIRGDEKTRICSDCARQITALLGATDKE